MDSQLAGKKIAMLVDTYFEQAELEGPKKALEEAGAETVIVSSRDQVQGMNGDVKLGDKFEVDVKTAELDPSGYDGLVVPGGVVNADHLRIQPEAQAVLEAFMIAKKPVAIICHGPWLLVSAGLAKGRKVTSYPTLRDDLQNAGAEWSDEEVIEDGNLITSRNPDDIPAFNRVLIAQLGGTPVADAVS
jgi:protease I